MLFQLLAVFSLVLCSAVIGCLTSLIYLFKNSSKLLENKVKEFDEITLKASMANQSMANMQTDNANKLNVLEDKINFLNMGNQNAGQQKRPY